MNILLLSELQQSSVALQCRDLTVDLHFKVGLYTVGWFLIG